MANVGRGRVGQTDSDKFKLDDLRRGEISRCLDICRLLEVFVTRKMDDSELLGVIQRIQDANTGMALPTVRELRAYREWICSLEPVAT